MQLLKTWITRFQLRTRTALAIGLHAHYTLAENLSTCFYISRDAAAEIKSSRWSFPLEEIPRQSNVEVVMATDGAFSFLYFEKQEQMAQQNGLKVLREKALIKLWPAKTTKSKDLVAQKLALKSQVL